MINGKFCILLVDDEKKMTRVIADFLRAKNFEVLEANDGQKALDLYFDNNSKIDLVLLDVMMPIVDGFEVLKQIRSQETDVAVIMLTAKTMEYDQLHGFENGADDYICKPFSTSILLARIENALKHLNKSIDKSFSVSQNEIAYNNRCVIIKHEEIDLTPREYELLDYLVRNKSIALTRDQILASVWGYNFEGEVRTVDTHIKQLRNKLGEFSFCIKTIHKIGYSLEVD